MKARSRPLSAQLRVALQWLLPTRMLSALVHRVAQVRTVWFKNALIRAFLRRFAVDLSEAEVPDATAYPTFNAFFTRALRAGARPQPDDAEAVTSPVDGTVSECGDIAAGRLLQAKGLTYTAEHLLGMTAEPFQDGSFCTIYLAPHNYHRIHAPMALSLRGWRHVPGRLFSVNPATVSARPLLFARNERVVAVFDTDGGPLAMVMVGALLVGSVDTVWAGGITPPHRRRSGGWVEAQGHFARGDELARFNMGSTVILLAAPGVLRLLPDLTPGTPLRVGVPIARRGARPSN